MKLIAAFFHIILLVQAAILVVVATEVKWTPNNDGDIDDPAAMAPKSQKYWDEHNIERPDYAKTDAEVMTESIKNATGGNAATSSWIKFLVVVVTVSCPIGYFIVWPRFLLHGNGHTLGSSSSGGGGLFSWLSGGLSKADPTVTRQARLSKFESSHHENKGGKVE
jgi:hypothetical protein